MCACSIYYIFFKINDECVNVCVASSFGEMASNFLPKFGVVGKTPKRDPGLRFFFFFFFLKKCIYFLSESFKNTFSRNPCPGGLDFRVHFPPVRGPPPAERLFPRV